MQWLVEWGYVNLSVYSVDTEDKMEADLDYGPLHSANNEWDGAL